MVLNFMERKIIKDQIRDDERAFYGSKNASFHNIKIEGRADGESAFKECTDIVVIDSSFKLRYPFWHNDVLECKSIEMFDTCRAAFWYDDQLTISNSRLMGIKALRECSNIIINDCEIDSDEFGWNCKNIKVLNTKIKSSYIFMGCSELNLHEFHLVGKYSFQYVNNCSISDSKLDTKDAFWHSKNVIVKNSVIKGEYLAWYSENLTLINCHISGTQPLCYCKGLKLVDCTFENADLCFEYSEVNGNIKGDVLSIKNPLRGELIIDGKTVYIKDEFDKSEGKFKLVTK